MDNHPIPQDVTHFQFKLVGQLTIKQFGYVIAGGILALICFGLPIIGFIKVLFVLGFAASGLIFAFIPIEGRPADLMVNYFFKALLEPNQYIYSKQGLILPYFQQITNKNAAITTQPPDNNVSELPTTPYKKTDTLLDMQLAQTGVSPVANFPTPMQPIPNPIQTPYNVVNATVPVQSSSSPISQPSQPIQNTIPQQKVPLEEQTSPQPQPPLQTSEQTNVSPLPSSPAVQTPTVEDQLKETRSEKEQLQKQLDELQEQLAKKQNQQPPPPQPQQTPPTPVSPIVKKITPSQNIKSSLIAPDFPNIVMGVVKDARGNVLSNILIEVKDNNNNPVRAFKTNALGQFASATPLLNGTYTIIFEDPGKVHTFEAVEISAKGDIMQPIEIISLDKREELRKELFG